MKAGKSDCALSRQLADVTARSAFYQSKFACAPGRSTPTADDLHDLPFTTRAELQEDQELHPPFGSYATCDPSIIARVHRTSGSSGKPLLIALSHQDIEDSVRVGADCFKAAGAGPGHLVIHCLNYCMWSGGLTDHEALERSGAGVIPFGVGKTSELIGTIRRVRPTGIHCTPSYLARIEERLAQSGFEPRSLNLRLGLFGGEPALGDPLFRARIEERWGLRAMDANYGMSEVLSMFGAECAHCCGLHFMGAQSLHVELKSPTSDRTTAWQRGAVAELVLTHLRRDCQPLIRYCSSDVIEVIDTRPCACGRTTPRFRVVGRVDDMLVIRGVNVFPHILSGVVNEFTAELSGEYRLRVNQNPPISECILLVERAVGQERPDLAARLAARLESAISIRPRIELLPFGGLGRTTGKSCRIERVL